MDEQEYEDRFAAHLISWFKPASDEARIELVKYAKQAAGGYFTDPEFLDDPESAVESDVSYWEAE